MGAWRECKFCEVGKIFSGNSINVKEKSEKYLGANSGIPYIGTKEVGFDHSVDYENGVRIPDKFVNKFKIAPSGSVVVCAEGGSAGRKVAYIERDVAFGNKLYAMVPTSKLLGKFFFYYCLSNGFKTQFQDALTGIIGGVSQKAYKNFMINVPDVIEQRKIVRFLDEALNGIDLATANAAKNHVSARELFQSELSKVLSQNREGWIDKKLCEVCDKITDGTHQTPKYFDSGFVFLSSKNVKEGVIDWNNIKYIDENQHIEMQKRLAPRLDDVLLRKNGAGYGKAALVDKDIIFDVYVSLAILRPLECVLPRYLLHFVNSPIAMKQFNDRIKGAGVPNLHLQEIREVVISFPKDIVDQQQIVERLDSFLTETKRLARLYEEKQASLSKLKRSFLARAFSGQLIAQSGEALKEVVA